jgi:hypothetical protein
MTGEHSSSSAFDASSSGTQQLVQSTLSDMLAVNSSNLLSILARHPSSGSPPAFEPAPLLQQPLLARSVRRSVFNVAFITRLLTDVTIVKFAAHTICNADFIISAFSVSAV